MTDIKTLLELNENLKKEMNEIRRQIKQTTRKRTDDQRVREYQIEAMTYQKELAACQKTVDHLQKTIETMQKQIEQLESTQNEDDHQFINELFHLCENQSSDSLKSPSTDQIKKSIEKTFHHLIKRTSEVDFNCHCSTWIDPNHYPTYQYALNILEQYQRLFAIECYKQIPISLLVFYHKYGELRNFIHSISTSLGIDRFNKDLVIQTLKNLVQDANLEQMNAFKQSARVKSVQEALKKVCSYDNFVPYYQQFLRELIELLDVSKSEEILPAIERLKRLAQTSD